MMTNCAVCGTRITTLREAKPGSKGFPPRPAEWIHLVDWAGDHQPQPTTATRRTRPTRGRQPGQRTF